jgi:hypothetical protein
MENLFDKIGSILITMCLCTVCVFFTTSVASAGIISMALYGVNFASVLTIIIGILTTFGTIILSLDNMILELSY